MDLFDQRKFEGTHVFISANCLAMMMAFASSTHSLYFDVECVGDKKIHVFIRPDSYLHLAQIASSDPESIALIEKANPGEFIQLCEESTKLNCIIKDQMLKQQPFDKGQEPNIQVQKIKLGTQMSLQVVGYCHGKNRNGQPMHLRTIYELPSVSQSKKDWKSQLSSRQDTILINEVILIR